MVLSKKIALLYASLENPHFLTRERDIISHFSFEDIEEYGVEKIVSTWNVFLEFVMNI